MVHGKQRDGTRHASHASSVMVHGKQRDGTRQAA